MIKGLFIFAILASSASAYTITGVYTEPITTAKWRVDTPTKHNWTNAVVSNNTFTINTAITEGGFDIWIGNWGMLYATITNPNPNNLTVSFTAPIPVSTPLVNGYVTDVTYGLGPTATVRQFLHPVTLPEPSTFGLAAMASIFLLRRRRISG